MAGNYLRQSTASQARAIGPFLDDVDFVTEETTLTIANTDIKLMVNGAASVNKNSGGGTHRVNGFYGVTFDATDTATVGELELSVSVAGALPVWKTFFVLEEAVYDALFAASAAGFATPAQVNAEMLDVMTVDTFAEIGQAAPPATSSMLGMFQYLYKAFRNKKTLTKSTGEFAIYADDGTTIDHKSTITDDGAVGTETEKQSGP